MASPFAGRAKVERVRDNTVANRMYSANKCKIIRLQMMGILGEWFPTALASVVIDFALDARAEELFLYALRRVGDPRILWRTCPSGDFKHPAIRVVYGSPQEQWYLVMQAPAPNKIVLRVHHFVSGTLLSLGGWYATEWHKTSRQEAFAFVFDGLVPIAEDIYKALHHMLAGTMAAPDNIPKIIDSWRHDIALVIHRAIAIYDCVSTTRIRRATLW